MSFDPVVTNSGRLSILTRLAQARENALEFVVLRRSTSLTDGNLSTHARRLEKAGLISIDKHLRDGRPVTTLTITPRGRLALGQHLRTLRLAVRPPGRIAARSVGPTSASQPVSFSHPPEPTLAAAEPVGSQPYSHDDDWID